MEKSVFFNSAPGDPRTYQASDFAGYFGTVLSSGLFHTNNVPALEVHCNGSDLRTYVNAGKAAIQGYFYENTSDLYLQHALPEASLDRIDRIVLRLDKRNQSRFIRLFIIQGVSAAAPVAPALQRDEYIYELCLAEIRVRANTSTLVPADLVDKRLIESLCGLVYSLISIPTSQFQQEWDAFMDGVQADYTSQVPYAVATGTANVYAISSPIASLIAGMAVSVNINVTSSGASTLNWDGKGAKGIKKSDGSNVTSLKAGGIYTFRYDGTNFIIQGEGASGNALASDLLSGKTASTDVGDIVGTMPNNGAVVYTPAAGNVAIANGYHIDSVVTGDPDLVSANIKAGANLFGVPGKSEVVDTTTGLSATAAQILAGREGFSNGAKVIGSMVNRGGSGQPARAVQITGTTLQLFAPNTGYYDTNSLLTADDPDFIAANIKNGANIFGLVGNFVSYGPGDIISSKKLKKAPGGEMTMIWNDTVSTPGGPSDACADSLGNMYVAYNVATGNKSLRKLSPSGAEIWAKTDHVNGVLGVAVDLNDNSVYCGINSGTNNLRKLDSAGNQIWIKSEATFLGFYSVKVDASGKVYGTNADTSGSRGAKKYLSDGTLVCTTASYTSGGTQTTDVAAEPGTGHFYTSGYSPSNTWQGLVKWDGASGNVIWQKLDQIKCMSVEVDPDGNVYSGGQGSAATDITFRKLSSSGGVFWDILRSQNIYERVQKVRIDKVGNVYVQGWRGTPQKVMSKFNANGGEDWTLVGTGWTSSVIGIFPDSNLLWNPGASGSNILQKADPSNYYTVQ